MYYNLCDRRFVIHFHLLCLEFVFKHLHHNINDIWQDIHKNIIFVAVFVIIIIIINQMPLIGTKWTKCLYEKPSGLAIQAWNSAVAAMMMMINNWNSTQQTYQTLNTIWQTLSL